MADDQKVSKAIGNRQEATGTSKAKLASGGNKQKAIGGGVEKLVDQIEKLSVLELSELVSLLQERLGVPLGPTQAVVSAPSAGQVSETPQKQEGATSQSTASATQTVVMTDSGANKILVIKALREINPNLGLKEAKDLTENLPAEILKDAKKEDAETAKKKLEEAGAKVELK